MYSPRVVTNTREYSCLINTDNSGDKNNNYNNLYVLNKPK